MVEVSHRIERVNSVIRQELSDLLRREIKDPRLGDFVAITEVRTSADMKTARVFVSYMGDAEEKRATMAALASAAGFLHHELTKRLDMRTVPDLTFEWDSSIERGDRLLRLIDEVASERKE